MKLFLVGIVLALVAWLVPWWILGVVAALAGSFLLPLGPEMTVPYFVVALFGVACLFVGYVLFLHNPDRRKWVRPLLIAGAVLLMPVIVQQAQERFGIMPADNGALRELADCNQVVRRFENELMEQDRKFHKAYRPFRDACVELSLPRVMATAGTAAQVAKDCSANVYQIDIPKNIPSELRELLVRAREAAGVSYFAKSKNVENIINMMTGRGEQYSTTEELLQQSDRLTTEAVWALSMAKSMVGLGLNAEETHPRLTLTLPADTPPEALELIKSVAPALADKLPGLVKYSSQLDCISLSPRHEAGLPGGGWRETITLELKVHDDADLPPELFPSRGHHIFLEIGADGKTLAVNKRAAVSLLLDKPFEDAPKFLDVKI